MKRYSLYHLRWQISGLVMIPPMDYMQYKGLPLWSNLLIAQAIGACCFWFFDKWLFRGGSNEV